ncbi:MAG: hypothetical protein JST00_22375 [Deltaproteobacteria bacterium]|nr:hypothetical protein [Deltaproteobacteria bacterium]
MAPSRLPCLFGALAIVTLSTRASATAYPPELDGGADCTLWRGTVSGNDPTVRMMFRLCPAGGDDVAGTGQWSSKVSGYNVRRLSGRWLDRGARLELHDEAVVEEHPEPGWRFCTIDRYDLRRSGDELVGTYDSRACNDHATIKVALVSGSLPPSGTPAPSAPPAPPPPSETKPTVVSGSMPTDPGPRSSSKSCGCSVPGGIDATRRELFAAGAFGLALLVARGRRLRRAGATPPRPSRRASRRPL